MVVLHNLRLPELDNNRNGDQQKALIFDADSCRYDAILGAEFLSKTGIDVKCSTGTIGWFDNELPLRDTRYLQSKDFLTMAKTIEIQLEDDFLAWIGMIQPDMHLKSWMKSMKRSLLMMLEINLIILMLNKRMTLNECSISISNYLMALWDSILTENSTMI
jgi:hypothetical protein